MATQLLDDSNPSLFDLDETAWLEESARLATLRRFEKVDSDHLAGFHSDMAKRDRREVTNLHRHLLLHPLKWAYQPEKRSKSRYFSIHGHQRDLAGLLVGNSLRNHAGAVLPSLYPVEVAAAETGFTESAFPSACPYALTDAIEYPVEKPH